MSGAALPITSISAESSRQSVLKSSGPRPFKVSNASINSIELPTARPSGWFISVIITMHSLFSPRAIEIIMRASSRASSSFFKKAPLPVFTSSTRPLAPSASFLLMIEAAISGRQATVAVTSRRANSFLSAGAISTVWPMSAAPTSSRVARNSASERSVLKPGIDSSLSSVPPECASARPEIIGTSTPAAATTGAITSDVLSPTPPVECLSTRGRPRSEKSTISPEWSIASVSASVSSVVMPRR